MIRYRLFKVTSLLSTLTSSYPSHYSTLSPSPTQFKIQNSQPHLIVLGGSGFIGSHICQAALSHGCKVTSLSRSGQPLLVEDWTSKINWQKVDLLNVSESVLINHFKGADGVISAVGGFGSFHFMEKINGDATINAVYAAKKAGVRNFVFISVHLYPEWVKLKGYFSGKRHAEYIISEIFSLEGSGTILRPSAVYGRRVMKIPMTDSVMTLPLHLVFMPLEKLTTTNLIQSIMNKPLIRLLMSPLLTPPVDVHSIAELAVRSAVEQRRQGIQILSVDDIRNVDKCIHS